MKKWKIRNFFLWTKISVFSCYSIDSEFHFENSHYQIFPIKCGIFVKMGWLLLWSNFDVTNWSLTTIRPYLGMGYAISGLATMPLTCSLTYMTLRGRLRPETLPKFVEKRLRTTSSRKLFQIFHTRIWLVYYLEINFTRWYTRYESFHMTFFEIEKKFNAKQNKFNFKIIDRPNGHAKCTKSARCFCWPYTCFPIKLYFPTISYSCSFHILFHWERLHRSICRKISFYESYSCWKLEYKS